MKKVLITPQGFSFIKNKIQDKFLKKHDYRFTNGIVEDKSELKELKDIRKNKIDEFPKYFSSFKVLELNHGRITY